jgi:hypothetical protein
MNRNPARRRVNRRSLFVSLIIFASQSLFAAHPSLYFSTADIPGIRTKATGSHAAIMQPILSQANSLLSSPVPSAPTGAAYTLLCNAARDIKVLSFAWTATGDTRYLNLARSYLASFSSWPFWGGDAAAGDRDLSLGAMISGCAFAYDWLYDSLSVADRTLAHNALVRHTQEMYEAATLAYSSAWNNWWTESYGQNHWDSNNSALGLAALALDGETDSASKWLGHAIIEMRKDSFDLANIVDGTWHEGCLYQNGKLSASMPFYVNLKRVKGIDLLPKSYLSAFALYALYNYLAGDRQMALTFSSYIENWGGWLAGAGYSLLALAGSSCGSEIGQWLWKKMGTELGRSSYQSGCHIDEFFYYSPDAAVTPPDSLPLSRTFSDLQGVIWRTGWGSNDLTFGLKTGAYGGTYFYNRYLSKQYPFDTKGANLNVGHNHADANTIWLYRGAVDLIGENEGRSLYNDLNAAYQSSSHNTLLVDGRGQYFPTDQTGVYSGNDGELGFGCSIAGFNFIESDATKRYRSTTSSGSIGPLMISRFVRNVLFVQPSYFIIVDNVADSAAHAYRMRFHFGDSATTRIDTSSGWIRGNGTQNNIVGVKTLVPSPYVWKEIDSVRPAIEIGPAQNVKQVDFAFVILPVATAQWTARPDFSLLGQTASATAIRTTDGIVCDHIIRHAGIADTAAIAGYKLNAKVASVKKTGVGRLCDLFIGNGLSLSDSNGSHPLFQSATAVDALHIAITDTAITVYLSQKGSVDLQFFAPGANPLLIKVPGWNVTAASIGDYIRITGPGRSAFNGRVRNLLLRPVISFDRGGKILRIRSVYAGKMKVRVLGLDGRCLLKRDVRNVQAGGETIIPLDMEKPGCRVVVVSVAMEGKETGGSVKRVIAAF